MNEYCGWEKFSFLRLWEFEYFFFLLAYFTCTFSSENTPRKQLLTINSNLATTKTLSHIHGIRIHIVNNCRILTHTHTHTSSLGNTILLFSGRKNTNAFRIYGLQNFQWCSFSLSFSPNDILQSLVWISVIYISFPMHYSIKSVI